ncbi:septal ring lytic transglycosylase RlpA family protein [Caldimonas aquatica]|uniref:Endolytic peptidoglycan transglycosylase RlpA n=1 Tax=Caldimonas aquatica TaxID=376175 RepID=A0ABY6MS95_9BURK|nr:septal ring lytic transglycosylase RlpA family protein [Schlegelella aquatica]UZD54886.1 septal ring lytic transglycosylase RlpA family protein [Schlegelella aquatica]
MPGPAASVPDVQPRVEPFAQGPNRPYVVRGREYTPVLADIPMRERGYASWYGRQFHGKRTASGEPYDMYAMTAAHPTMPIPSYARVRHPATGREVIVRINDRGPFHGNRIIDLSYMAALKLGVVHRGSALVEVERLTHDEIRAGTWRRAPGEPVQVASSPAERPSRAGGLEPVMASPTEALPGEGAAGAPAAPRSGGAAQQPGLGFWVQLGAFRQREGAQGFRQRVSSELEWLAPVLAVVEDAPVYRLQAGPYRSREEAAGIAERVREALRLVPVVVERR